ncbi:MAG: ABC transporter ATP-binding protein [Chloroflexota bacterium]
MSFIDPHSKIQRASQEQVRDALCADIEQPIADQIDLFWGKLGASEHQRGLARQRLARETILQSEADNRTDVCRAWLLRPRPGTPLTYQIRHNNIIQPALFLLGTVTVWRAIELGSWAIIGAAVFQGHMDWAWFVAWALALVTIVVCKLILFDSQDRLATNFLKMFKSKLMYGALRFNPDEIRQQGTGQFLSRVMDSEIVEAVSLIQGVQILTQTVLLSFVGIALTFGSGGILQAFLLLGWVGVTIFLSWRYLRVGREWIQIYRGMSQDLVENMIGHRTRLVQENRAVWHDLEDKALERYLQTSRTIDQLEMLLRAFIPRGWMLIGFGSLIPSVLRGTPNPVEIAISLGGILFAYQAFTDLGNSLKFLLRARLSQDQVEPIMDAADRPLPAQSPLVLSRLTQETKENVFLVMRDVSFSYSDHLQSVFEKCNLQITQGDRLLLEGPSGSGKSTLAAILGGLHTQKRGMLLLQGLDKKILGQDKWRQDVLIVPQFQENHIFTETLEFNLFMGHRWPASPADLEEAEIICRELGLGYLLDQMPNKFEQSVGDGGWLLSHGERSRLYIARALLQKPKFLILDESFGSLDPEALQLALRCVLKRVPTLMVIAHP